MLYLKYDSCGNSTSSSFRDMGLANGLHCTYSPYVNIGEGVSPETLQ